MSAQIDGPTKQMRATAVNILVVDANAGATVTAVAGGFQSATQVVGSS